MIIPFGKKKRRSYRSLPVRTNPAIRIPDRTGTGDNGVFVVVGPGVGGRVATVVGGIVGGVVGVGDGVVRFSAGAG
jgi:hypothetical protein